MHQDHTESLIHELFARQARTTPQAIALHEADQSCTYAELEEQVKGVAGALSEQGIRSGCSVGLHIERSIDWAIGLLGILTANAAVVPLPPSHPAGWLRDTIAFADLDAVIDHRQTPLPGSIGTRVYKLDELSAGSHPLPTSAPGAPGQPAFVLTSSGSTGKPKLIVRSHRSFFHRLQWTWTQHPYEANEVCCQKSHMTTTHAVYELLEPLLKGVPVVILPDRDVRDLEAFWLQIKERCISRLLLVPSTVRASLDMPGFKAPQLKVLVLMGEYVAPGLADRTVEAFSQQTHIYSIYGSTEASSTLVSDLRIDRQSGEELPLGTPITPEVLPLVLGSDLKPVGPGGVGRLHIAGPALFTEYLGDADLTAAAFVEAPDCPGPLFDTSDQVRVIADGNIQFVGRVGETVKIRGFRVDLRQVEQAILNHPGVSQAVVVVSKSKTGNTSMAAFYLPQAVGRSSIFETLKADLPPYMIPSTLVKLDEFPLTASGKVDRIRLLRDFDNRPSPAAEDRTPTPTELRVRPVWEQAIGHDRFSLADSFFEVGGDSLSVFSLVFGLRQAFGLAEDQLTEQTIYSSPSVEGLASRIDSIMAGETATPAEETPLLVVLRKGRTGAGSPLFMIPSAGGTLGAYDKLTKALKTGREIIGVRDPFNWGKRDPTKGFEHWVDLFVTAIEERQPVGPYYLCAYSSAGAFGYEIARRLRQDGHEVGLLALIDPLALDRRNQWTYGYWALRAAGMRPAFRKVVLAAGRLRVPLVRLLHTVGGTRSHEAHSVSDEDFRRVTSHATRSKDHILTFSALLELNTGLPFALSAADLAGVQPDNYVDALLSRVKSLTPDVDPERIRTILIQYSLQVQTQHAYELQEYDGPVFLVEPATSYNGLLANQFRPHVKNLETMTLALGQPTERTMELVRQFGSLGPHYRSMRDDVFVTALASELDARID